MAGEEQRGRTRPAVGGIADDARPLPSWLRRAARPRAAEEGPAQLPWALLLCALTALTLGVDLAAPNQLGAGALMVIPVLAASWTLGSRALVAVLAVVLVVEVVGIVLGRLEPLAVGGRLVTVAAVTAGARSAAFSFAEARRARRHEVDVLRTELAEAKERLQQGVELALEVGRSLEPEQVLDSVLVRLTTSMEADQATLLRVDGCDLVIEATYRPGAGRGTPTRRHFPPELVEHVPQLARALATGEPAVGGPLEMAPGAEELFQALPTGIHTLILPYAVDGRIARVFALGRDEGRAFERADLAHLAPMADVAVLALRNAIRHATTEGVARAASRHSGRLVQAIEAAEEIGSAEQLQDAVERARRLAVSVLRADRGNISRLEGDELVVEHDHRPILPYPRRRPLSRSRMAAEAIRTRRPVHGRVADGSVGPDGIAWMVPAGLLYAIQCPLIVGGEVVGVLGLGRTRDEPFTDADGEALMPFAKLVGLLLQNARRLAEARQTGQVKSHFMALAAHELRTPLTVIRGYLALLEDGTYPVPDRTRAEAVETLVSKAQELESLVDSLVMAARLEGRTLAHAAGDLDMIHEVAEAMERLRPRARLEDARLSTRVLGRRHRAMADRSHVALILNNLLNNALTYSSVPADVTVEVRGGDDAVEVAVVDRGHGIPRDQHERVFERFHRAHVGPARTAAGLGLGLTISQELAQLNGGELVLERSVPGQGSVFVLRLPHALPAAAQTVTS